MMKHLDEHPEDKEDPDKRQDWIEAFVLHPEDGLVGGEHSQSTYLKEEAWKRAKYWFSLWTHLNMKEVDKNPELRTYKHYNSSNLLRNGFICPHDYRAGSSIQIVHPKLGEKW